MDIKDIITIGIIVLSYVGEYNTMTRRGLDVLSKNIKLCDDFNVDLHLNYERSDGLHDSISSIGLELGNTPSPHDRHLTSLTRVFVKQSNSDKYMKQSIKQKTTATITD
uniref:Uncharacterized protein n=1 Tax=Glossina austeni TaxID=7395 RepID=A0A1A9UH52_GLOAU